MKYLEVPAFIARILGTRSSRKLMALDVGTKHVGVAITDESQMFVSPYSTISRTKPPIHRMSPSAIKSFEQKLQSVIDKEAVCGIVVGLPLKDGEPTPFCQEIVDMMLQMNCFFPQSQYQPATPDSDSNANAAYEHKELARKEPMEFTLWDEYGSTMDSRRLVASTSNKRSVYLKKKDSMAASVILQRFLTSYGYETCKSKNNKNKK